MSNQFLDPVVRFHFRFFQFLGYQSISLDLNAEGKKRTELIIKIWTVFLILSFSILTLHTFLSDDDYLYTDDAFGYLNDILQISIAHLAVTVSFLETILRRQDQRIFWQLYITQQQRAAEKQPNTNTHNGTSDKSVTTEIIERHTRNRLWTSRQQLRSHVWFLQIFYGILAAEISVHLSFYLLHDHIARHLLLFWIMFTPYIMTVRFRNMQCIFHMECMRLELQQLALELRLLVEFTNFGERVALFDGFGESVRRKLVELQMNYECIHEMFCSYQKSFGFSTVLVLLMGYVRVLVDTYFFYYTMYSGKDSMEDILLIPALFEIPMFLLTSKNCMNAVKHITLQLHNIKHDVDNPKISVQIQNFSLQLLHQRIRINAVGISVMDGYMLSKAIGSITTYMIFFTQFMPTFKKF